MKPWVRRSLAICVAAALVTVSSAASAEPPAPLPPPALSPAESSQLRQLQLRLDDLGDERANTSTVLPWTVLALGIGAIVVGGSISLARIASCEGSCTSQVWPHWVVAAGTAVSTGGLIWLKLVQEDISELESRRYQLQMQIDGYETVRQAREQHAQVQVGGRF